MSSAELLPAEVLRRKAVVYVRQSSQAQVQTNLERTSPAAFPIRAPSLAGAMPALVSVVMVPSRVSLATFRVV
jgi:hypothetical protein